MSTTSNSRPTPSLRDRRLQVLVRKGSEDKRSRELGKPIPAFYWIQIIAAGLVMLGLTMVFSSSSVNNLHSGSSAFQIFWKQVLWVGVGVLAGWAAYSFPYQEWAKKTWLLTGVSAVVLLLNLIVLTKGVLVNGARAWLDIGPLRFQPSEFMKIVAVLMGASLLSARHRYVEIRSVVWGPMMGLMGITSVLCALQKDFGSAVIFVGIIFSMLFMASLPLRQLFLTFVAVGVGGVALISSAGRAKDRFVAFLDLEGTKDTTGYQVYQALLSIANGGLQGTGVGAGTSKWGYVPLAYSDFIFCVIAEELGLAGVILVIGGFCMLSWFGIQVALRATDLNGAFIAGGISAWFAFQAFVNIGGVVGLIPMTGLTLPFLSYGGSSMIASLAAIGLLVNVARYAKQ